MTPTAPIKTYKLEFNWFSEPNIVLSDENNNILYTALTHFTAPHVVFQSPAHSGTIGEATESTLHSHIELAINGTPYKLDRQRLVLEKYDFVTAKGQRLIFDWALFGIDVKDAQNNLVMKIKHHGWTSKEKLIDVWVDDLGEEVWLAAITMTHHLVKKHRRQIIEVE